LKTHDQVFQGEVEVSFLGCLTFDSANFMIYKK
jgi:hypothetical protein